MKRLNSILAVVMRTSMLAVCSTMSGTLVGAAAGGIIDHEVGKRNEP